MKDNMKKKVGKQRYGEINETWKGECSHFQAF